MNGGLTESTSMSGWNGSGNLHGVIANFTMKTSRKKVAILTTDKFEDMELFFPLVRLLESGWEVDIAADHR